MTVASAPAALAASVVAIAAALALCGTISRHRADPATRPLLGLAAALAVGGVVHLAVVDLAPVRRALGLAASPTELVGGVWLLVAFDLAAVVSGLWFLFALQYTGRDRAAPPVASAAVGVLLVGLVAPTVVLGVVGAAAGIPTQWLNVLLGVTLILAESLALIGVFLVVATTLRRRAIPTGQTALLVGSVSAVLALPVVATTVQRPVATPVAIAVCATGLAVAVRRYRVFETMPVAWIVGRDRVIDEMADGVVLVDDAGTIRDLNPAAAAAFGVDGESVAGAALTDALPSVPAPAALPTDRATDVQPAAGGTVAVTADVVTDDRGRALGHLLVCRDVTAARRREHRLGVLTRTLAGATRGEMTAVATTAADGAVEPTTAGERIHARATGLATLVARVRDVEGALADRPTDGTTADLASVLAGLDLPASVDVVPPATATPVAGDADLLAATLSTLATAPADVATLDVTGADDAVEVGVSPYRRDDPLADRALEIARLAVEPTDWELGHDDESVTVTLPSRPATRGVDP